MAKRGSEAISGGGSEKLKYRVRIAENRVLIIPSIALGSSEATVDDLQKEVEKRAKLDAGSIEFMMQDGGELFGTDAMTDVVMHDKEVIARLARLPLTAAAPETVEEVTATPLTTSTANIESEQKRILPESQKRLEAAQVRVSLMT